MTGDLVTTCSRTLMPTLDGLREYEFGLGLTRPLEYYSESSAIGSRFGSC